MQNCPAFKELTIKQICVFLCFSGAPVVLPNRPQLQLKHGAPKRSLNLDDYKKRKGLI